MAALTFFFLLLRRRTHDSAYCKAIHPPNYHHNSRKPLIPAALSSNGSPPSRSRSSACRCGNYARSRWQRQAERGWATGGPGWTRHRGSGKQLQLKCTTAGVCPGTKTVPGGPFRDGLSHKRLGSGTKLPRSFPASRSIQRSLSFCANREDLAKSLHLSCAITIRQRAERGGV